MFTQFKAFENKTFFPGISISFKCECHNVMQIQYTKDLSPGKFELGTTLSWPIRSIDMKNCHINLFMVCKSGEPFIVY